MLKINFTKSPDGLVPTIIQDAITNTVLMLGYMNEESWIKTLESKKVTFFSRSKKRLWTKGEESGNFLHVLETMVDCDNDTLLIKVKPEGPVCHTGNDTCFAEQNKSLDFITELENTIKLRQQQMHEKSYTSSLFEKGINKIAQKVGEEAVELVIEAKDNNPDLFINEAADLFFHYLILLRAKKQSFKEVVSTLKKRSKANN